MYVMCKGPPPSLPPLTPSPNQSHNKAASVRDQVWFRSRGAPSRGSLEPRARSHFQHAGVRLRARALHGSEQVRLRYEPLPATTEPLRPAPSCHVTGGATAGGLDGRDVDAVVPNPRRGSCRWCCVRRET